MVQYWYDAWGNHKVVDANGNEITDQNHIGNVNPFRYRGYYFDVETGLYYLQTRYYDPTTGRFLNRDSIAYADPESIHGLNLYAYCGNNPVNYIDPTGHFGFVATLILAAVAGAVIKGTIDGVNAYNEGRRGLELFASILGGILEGGAMGAIMVIGGAAGLLATGVTTVTGFTLSKVAALGLSLLIGTTANVGSYLLVNGLHEDKNLSWGGFGLAALSGALKSFATFTVGYIGGYNGLYNKLGNFSTMSDFYIKMVNSHGKINPLTALFYGTSVVIGNTLTRALYLSSSASGIRFLIDWLLG